MNSSEKRAVGISISVLFFLALACYIIVIEIRRRRAINKILTEDRFIFRSPSTILDISQESNSTMTQVRVRRLNSNGNEITEIDTQEEVSQLESEIIARIVQRQRRQQQNSSINATRNVPINNAETPITCILMPHRYADGPDPPPDYDDVLSSDIEMITLSTTDPPPSYWSATPIIQVDRQERMGYR